MADQTSAATVEVRVDTIGQLFDALDPVPVPQRDLAASTEEFIVGWARELPRRQPIRIIVHVPPGEAGESEARNVREALRHYFRYRAERIGLDLKEMFRIGRWSLAIGLVVLAVCVTVGQVFYRQFGDGYLNGFFSEGLIIIGWVANWRPAEIFLYDWWPLARQRALYRRLSTADIVLKTYQTAAA